MKFNEYTTEYLRYKKVRDGVCQGTMDKYAQGFKKIGKTMGNLDISEIDQDAIFDWEIRLENEGLSANSRRFIVGLFRGYLAFLSEVKKMKAYDYREIFLPKPENKPVRYLNEQEVEEIIQNLPEKNLRDLRFKTLFCLLASSGGRINEVLNIKVENINFESREVLVLAKGRRYRKIFFDERAEHYLKQFLSKK